MNVFVTGATGFIGGRLVEKLAGRGIQVHVLCRKNADTSRLPKKNVHIFYGDILDRDSLEQAMSSCIYVFHLAALAKNWAPDPEIFYRVNVQGTINVLESAKNARVHKTLITSTCLTLGLSNGKPVNENAPRPDAYLTEYTRSKIIAEDIIRKYVSEGMDIRIVNPTRVFGPGILSEANSVTEMIRLYMLGKWRLILGDGDAIGNYAYIDDVVQGHLLALEKGQPGESYLLGGENLTYNHFFNEIKSLSGKDYFLIHMPARMARLFSCLELYRAKLTRHHPLITPDWVALFLQDGAYSSSKAERELNYRITPFKHGIQSTIFWLDLCFNNFRR